MSKTIVYTAIFGNYDLLPKIISDNDGIEYYCFTDSIPENTNGWNCVFTPAFFKDNKLNTGYVKANPQFLFSWDSIVVWIDSNLEQIELTKAKIADYLQDNYIAALPHRFRKTVLGEAAVVAEYNLDNKNKISKWEMELLALGYPDHIKLVELSFFIRDLRQPKVRYFNSTWWKYMIHGSRRDQLSFNPALWLHSLDCHLIKVDVEDSKRDEYFKFLFQPHIAPQSRSISNSFPAHDIDSFSPYCWAELRPSTDRAGAEHSYFFYAQESWQPELLEQIKDLNTLILTHQVPLLDNYFFVEKTDFQKHSVPDIRYAWKREYLRKSILPSRWGLEIGFGHGHSTALMLAYNPNVSIIAIESYPDPSKQACAEIVLAAYSTRLEVYFEKTAEVLTRLSLQLPFEKIEFIHYNSREVFDHEEFWGFMEWFLTHSTVGCRLILSDITPEINSFLTILQGQKCIDNADPGMPAMNRIQQFIKIAHATPELLRELKAMDRFTNPTESAGIALHHYTLNLQKNNHTLSLENNVLRQQNESLKTPTLKTTLLYLFKKNIRRLKNILPGSE